jgi:hypothetical protein
MYLSLLDGRHRYCPTLLKKQFLETTLLAAGPGNCQKDGLFVASKNGKLALGEKEKNCTF